MNSSLKTKDINGDIIDNFIRIISHEIRTPIHAILNGIILSPDLLVSNKTDGIQIIHEGANWLLHVMEIIADMSSFRSSDYSYLPSTVSIKSLIADLTFKITNHNDFADISAFQIKSAVSKPDYYFDEEMISKILHMFCMNILAVNNSAKIVISFQSDSNGTLIITIIENSTGIPVSKVPFIYNPFRTLYSEVSELYLIEGRVLYHIFLNELLNHIDAKIDIVTKNPNDAIFKISIPLK